MNKIVLTLLFFALLALSASIAKDEFPDSPLPKVLIIGDSISEGYTPHVTRMLEEKAIVIHHKGNGGPTMRGIALIDEWLGSTTWDVIHFNWGLWDMYGWEYEDIDRTPLAYEKRLDSLVVRLKKTEARLIWATTTPVCPDAEKKCKVKVDPLLEKKYLMAATRVMQKHNVDVNDLFAFMSPQRRKYAIADNDVHYTNEGNEKLAAEVADQITTKLIAG